MLLSPDCKSFVINYRHLSKNTIGNLHDTNFSRKPKSKMNMMSSIPIEKSVFGIIGDIPIHQFVMTNKYGVKARVMEYGAILVSMEVPDSSGTVADLTHGFDTLEEWVSLNSHYFGASIGRYGNRIAHGCFNIGESTYQLATNNNPGGIPCSLHGGSKGFNQVIWKGSILNDNNAVEFSYTSIDGEEGYPGNVEVKVIYTLTEENELIWEAIASTDAPTVVNLVHHSYWNLSGNPKQSILDHLLQIKASSYLPTNIGLIPTGDIATVNNTPMDFTKPRLIGERIEDDFEAIKLGAGYDHCWVLDDNNNEEENLNFAAQVEHPQSGRCMTIFTNQKGIQFYTSNFLDGSVLGKNGVAYPRRSALCLETQMFPNSPNQPDFPSCLLVPGQVYKHTLVHKFSFI